MSVTKMRINQTQIDFKDSVVAATTAAITTVLTAAPDTVDGVALAVGDRVLVKTQAAGAENGIYVVDTLGTGANGVWSRVEDMYTADVIERGLIIIIQPGGTVNALKGFMLSSAGTAGAHIVGTTAQTYTSLADANEGVTLAQHIYNEVMTGTIDSANKVFTTAAAFATGKLAVYLNGVRQVLGDDYTVTDVDEVTMTFAPKSAQGNPDILTFDYLTA
jgi:hypothetical protein